MQQLGPLFGESRPARERINKFDMRARETRISWLPGLPFFVVCQHQFDESLSLDLFSGPNLTLYYFFRF